MENTEIQIKNQDVIEDIVINNILPPSYDRNGTETISQYQRRIRDFQVALSTERYNATLEFINQWLKLKNRKFKSLLDFKKIQESVLLKDTKHNRSILRAHAEKIMNLCKLEAKIDEETESEEIDDMYIFKFVRQVLHTFEYTLVSRMNMADKKIYYSILFKKP